MKRAAALSTELPFRMDGKYGKVMMDRAANGSGFVVTFEASEAVKASWGNKSRWYVFPTFQTGLAYYLALTGVNEQPTARRRQGSKGSRLRVA
uniref:Uncharacterized protein n=1 Tax=uncultured prokaryote TaxID=198431 RepID=A0A0H5Q590_9ZZZZ|nr:hypothetical protein [uncultured prokaryote]